MKRKMLILTIIALFFVYVCFRLFFDKQYTREQLTQNFIEHKQDFLDVVTYFKLNVPKERNYELSFGLGKWRTVDLELYADVIDSSDKPIGGVDLHIGSPTLDSALNVLGWSNEIVKELRKRLAKTNCDHIRTTNVYGGNPIEIWPNQTGGWNGAFSYSVFDKPMSESLIKIKGIPIDNSDFGRRVVIQYVPAL